MESSTPRAAGWAHFWGHWKGLSELVKRPNVKVCLTTDRLELGAAIYGGSAAMYDAARRSLLVTNSAFLLALCDSFDEGWNDTENAFVIQDVVIDRDALPEWVPEQCGFVGRVSVSSKQGSERALGVVNSFLGKAREEFLRDVERWRPGGRSAAER